MKCIGLIIVLLCAVVLETSSRPASEAILARQRRRNRNNGGQRRVYLTRQATPITLSQQPQQQQVAEVFEEELPTALTEADFITPNQNRIVNAQVGNAQSQRFIGTGFGSLLTQKQNFLGLLASTSTTTTTTAAPQTTTQVGTLTGVITLTPTARGPELSDQDPIAPSGPAAQRVQQQVLLRPVASSAYAPYVIRRRHGPGGLVNRLRPSGGGGGQVIRGANGGQIVRFPIPIRLSG